MAVTPNYTLQILSFYGESGLLGVQTAPIMGAMIDKFDDLYANTLILGEGDSYIPGPWLVGGADPSLSAVAGIGSTALGRPDIAIMNAFGTDASALGNHEFDLGSPVLQGAIAASGAWVGAQFPLITTNLSFAADSSLRGLADASLGGTATNAFAGAEASTIKGKIAPYAVVTQGGEKIGIVGATTYDLLSKTSPNGTVVKDDANPATSDLQEVAAYLQAAVDALKALGVNKIVMVDQLDTIQRNIDLAPLVSGIDVMVAGGGHERLGDATDTAVAFNGHDATFAGNFPVTAIGADGKAVLIVTTDTEFSYLGRLVVDFDANGDIITGNLDPAINGSYASTEANLQAAYGSTATAAEIIATSTIGTKVQGIATAIDTIISAKDSNVFGYTNVYLEGDRVFGRTEETNLGDISADANIEAASHALGGSQPYLVSLKNGGGLRASVGAIDENGGKIAPLATDVKAAGGISQLDIENALRFDNKMMVFDTTPQGLMNIFNFAGGLSSGAAVQSGGFSQVGGLRYSYDPDNPVGSKLVNLSLTDNNGNVIARVVENGVLVPGAPATISVVCLNFTTNGGDGYPIKANATNFRFLLNDGTLSAPVNSALDFTAAANVPANAVGEQKTFEDYLQAHYATPATAYNVADTTAALDVRVENLNRVVADNVFLGKTLDGSAAGESLDGTAGDDHIYAQAGNDIVHAGDGNDVMIGGVGADLLDGGAGNDVIVADSTDTVNGGAGRDVLYAADDTPWTIDLGATSVEYMSAGAGNDSINAQSQTAGVEVYANAGNDVVIGSAQADQLWGGTGDDILVGGAGNDVLVGESGADILLGGDGNDVIYTEAADALVDGGAGTDVLYIAGPAAGMSISLAATHVEFVADVAGGNDTIDGTGVAVDVTVYAGVGNDNVTGGNGADFLWGEAGNDTISGGIGNDVLVGGVGADILTGGAGNDTIYAGFGSGGDGAADVIVYNAAGWGTDFVYDFEVGLDKLNLQGSGAMPGTIQLSDVSGNAHVQFGADTIIVVGVSSAALATDILF